MRAPLRRVADWWERRRGRKSRLLTRLIGPGEDPGGTGVREPRRPRTPSLSGAVALREPGAPETHDDR